MLTEVGLDQQSSDPPLFILIHILNIIILSDSTTTRHRVARARQNRRPVSGRKPAAARTHSRILRHIRP
jgi:hypothetical protein